VKDALGQNQLLQDPHQLHRQQIWMQLLQLGNLFSCYSSLLTHITGIKFYNTSLLMHLFLHWTKSVFYTYIIWINDHYFTRLVSV